MAWTGRVEWWGQEDCALLMGEHSPQPSDGWGAPLGSVLSICSSWLANSGVTDGADGGMQIGRCRWRGADGARCRWGRGRKPLPASPQKGREKRNGCTTLHLSGNSPRPLFSLCGFYIIACKGFGASEAHPQHPQIQLIMLCCLVFPMCLAPFQTSGGDGRAPSWS